jgi:hypothetical protein
MVAIACALVACQALLLKTPSNTWVDAMSAHRWLYVIYFLVASNAAERIMRWLSKPNVRRYFGSRARIASPTSLVE